MKVMSFMSDTFSPAHMKEMIAQAIAAVSTETLEKLWKNIKSRLKHIQY